jgi:hypothetical protein
VRCDNGDALYLLMVVYEAGMIFEGRNIVPAVEPGRVNMAENRPEGRRGVSFYLALV